MTRPRILSIVLLAASLFGSSLATAQSLACDTTITASVTLQSNLVCQAGQNGLLVGADDVTIDLNGFSILGPAGSTQPVAIHAYGVHRVSILGPGSIAGFQRPIYLHEGEGHYIYAVDMRHTEYPVMLSMTNDSKVANNWSMGIQLVNFRQGYGKGNAIVDNTIRGGLVGIEIIGCEARGNFVANNKVAPTAPIALRVAGGAAENLLVANRIAGQTAVEGGLDNRFEKNEFDNTVHGGTTVYVGPTSSACGIAVGSNGNVFVGNVVHGGDFGFALAGRTNPKTKTSGNVLTGNHIISPAQTGIYFLPLADGNDARGNLYTSVPQWVVDFGSGNLWP